MATGLGVQPLPTPRVEGLGSGKGARPFWAAGFRPKLLVHGLTVVPSTPDVEDTGVAPTALFCRFRWQ